MRGPKILVFAIGLIQREKIASVSVAYNPDVCWFPEQVCISTIGPDPHPKYHGACIRKGFQVLPCAPT